MLLPPRDLELFREGTHWRLWQLLGAHVTPDGVRFAVWAPNARAVHVVGDWDQPADGDVLQQQGTSGIWACVSTDAQVGQSYRFAITGASGDLVLKSDPMARYAEGPPSNASVVVGGSKYEWSDDRG